MAYIGVKRGDMQGPIAIMDLEAVSQYIPTTEPRGQERRFGRPTPESVGAAMSAVPAGVKGTVDISTVLTITGSNNVLSAKTAAADSLTNVTIPPAVYASVTALVAALNGAIRGAGLTANVILSSSDDGTLVLQSNQKGFGSYIASGAGTFNTAAGLSGTFTFPTPAAVITAMSPPGGSLNMSAAAQLTNFGAGGTDEQRDTLIGSIAPHFIETDAFVKSFQIGMISGYRSATYNPDPSRVPALTLGAAINVVQDDGTTAFAAPAINITAAASNSPSPGDLTITGTSLGNPEHEATVVRVYSADGSRSVKIFQKQIQASVSFGTQGVVSATSIVIPASLLRGLGVAGSKVRVQYTSVASNLFTVT